METQKRCRTIHVTLGNPETHWSKNLPYWCLHHRIQWYFPRLLNLRVGLDLQQPHDRCCPRWSLDLRQFFGIWVRERQIKAKTSNDRGVHITTRRCLCLRKHQGNARRQKLHGRWMFLFLEWKNQITFLAFQIGRYPDHPHHYQPQQH